MSDPDGHPTDGVVPTPERTGVLVNASAGRVRRDPGLVDRLRTHVPARNLRLTHKLEEVEPAMRDLRDLGIDMLVAVGGDGTVTGTLTALLRVWADAEPPAVSLARGGSVNTGPAALGAGGAPDRHLERLLAHPPRHEERRPVLEIEVEGGVRHGLIFANGAGTRFLDAYHESQEGGPGRAAWTLARVAFGGLVDTAFTRALFAPFEAEVRVDDEPIEARRFTAMAAASVRDVGLGFRPFTSAGSDPERFHFIHTDGNARALALEVPGQAVGVTPPWTCLHHASPRSVAIAYATPQPWTVDGDLFPPAARLEMRTSRPIRFVVP